MKDIDTQIHFGSSSTKPVPRPMAIPPPARPELLQSFELVRMLDYIMPTEYKISNRQVTQSDSILIKSTRAVSRLPSLLLLASGSADANAIECKSMRPATRISSFRVRFSRTSISASSNSTNTANELPLWRSVLSHAALHYLVKLELHPTVPIPSEQCRAEDHQPSTYLPVGVLSALTLQVLRQLTHLKLINPHPDDSLLDLTMMTQLHTLAIRNVGSGSLSSIIRCQSVRHFRLLDGAREYVYNGRTELLFCSSESSLKSLESLYIGWNCWQPFESPWAGKSSSEPSWVVHRFGLFVAFSSHLTNLVQLELEGLLAECLLDWNFEEHWGFRGHQQYGELVRQAEKINWKSGHHAGVLTLCHSLRRLIIYDIPKGVHKSTIQLFAAILHALSHITITIRLRHPSLIDCFYSSIPDLLKLAPRLIVKSHPAELETDYVPMHGEAF